jgi:tRNA modification GTPase
VADTIAATTQGALGLAQQHLAGSLSGQIEQARAEIVAIAAELSAWLDFSEEDLADIDRQAVTERLARIQDQLKAWISAGRTGAIVREGFRVAIIGLPNAGKSSLLNALAGYDRAIVTDVAGTTRDTLQETIEVEGLAVHIVDTAGLNDDPDQVEAIGIERALAAAGSAQLLIVTASADQYLEPLASNLEPLDSNKLLAVQTKVDVLTGPVDWPFKTDGTIRTSAKTGEGLNELRRRIYQAAIDEAELPSVLTANERHLAALRNCSELLSEVMSSLAAEAPLDVVAAGLTEAAQELTTIVGVNVGSEVIDAIFSRFCIGK